MPKALIVYATREGQTEKVANAIGKHLEASGVRAEVRNARDIGPQEETGLGSYDLLVVGASMHAGGLERELVRFVERHSAELPTVARSLFVVLLSAATKDADLRAEMLADAQTKIEHQIGKRFDDIEMIAGALSYSQYSKPVRWLMQRIARKAGGDTDVSRDHEYTDWEQVERYAVRLSALARQSPNDGYS